jgi:hypothetical protein
VLTVTLPKMPPAPTIVISVADPHEIMADNEVEMSAGATAASPAAEGRVDVDADAPIAKPGDDKGKAPLDPEAIAGVERQMKEVDVASDT